jgi:hypothetical protein
VQRPAAIALIRGEPQMVDEHREGREREVMREDDPDAQRLPCAAVCGRNTMYQA